MLRKTVSDPPPALEALLGELTRRGSLLHGHMRAGLGIDEVASRMSVAGARPHTDVLSLYAWHDGFDRFGVPTSPEGMVALFPGHREFNGLDESLNVFRRWRKMAEAEAAVPLKQVDGSWRSVDPEQIWSRSWFPVFEGGGSELIYISNETAHPGSVWLHPIQDAPRRLYDSLAEAADAVRTALISGRLLVDHVGAFVLEATLSSGIEI